MVPQIKRETTIECVSFMANRKSSTKVVNKGYGRKYAFIIEYPQSRNSELGYEDTMP